MNKPLRPLNSFLVFISMTVGLGLIVITLGQMDITQGLAQEGQPEATFTLTPVPYFLYPPYPGSVGENSIFDHGYPKVTDNNTHVITWDGHQGECGVEGGSTCYSPSLSFPFGYDGHNGIDYAVRYKPIYAAADSTEILYAG